MAVIAAGMTVTPAFAQQSNSKSKHSNIHKELLASQSPSQVKIMESNSFIDILDDLEPEPDIYTEGWNSKAVNPFREADVPATDVIDVTGYYMPVPGKVTSNYGYRPRFGRMHKGIDLALKSNDTVYAAFNGKVRLTNYEAKGYGNYVILRHPNKLETVYGHLNKILVKPDQTVKAGDPIGLGGSTGRSTGPHLHFETRYMGYAINPSAIFDFANHTTHTDTYTFSKKTYTQARNFDPKQEQAAAGGSDGKFQKASAKSTYKVKRGDSISSISRAYGMSTATLRRLNGLKKNETLKVGQILKLK